MNLSRPTAALAALIMNSACSDLPESQQATEAFSPDTSSDVPRLSSETKSDVSATCSGFTLTGMYDEEIELFPMGTTMTRGNKGMYLACWNIINPCDKPLTMQGAIFTRGGTSPMGQFTQRHIWKVTDMRVIDEKHQTITFPNISLTFPANDLQGFCISGNVPADALCNTPTTYSLENAEDLNMTYDGKPVTAEDFVDTDFPAVGGKITVACDTKFIHAQLNPKLYSPPSGAPIDSTVNCLSVDISSNGNYETVLNKIQIDVERQGASSTPSAEGGLLDTSKSGEIKPNVGGVIITKTFEGDSNPVGVTLLSIDGNDDVLHFPHTLGDLEAAHLLPHTKQTFTFGLGIGNTQALVGDQVRCVFRQKPVITSIAPNSTPFEPLDPAFIGPEKDIVGPWITITGK